MPPPDATGAEADYLAKKKESRAPMVVHLTGGEMVRGVIEYYDRDMVKINRTEGPNLFIRKADIRYMHGDEEADRASRT
jgi:sRNA-binding regulator protein Hfq